MAPGASSSRSVARGRSCGCPRPKIGRRADAGCPRCLSEGRLAARGCQSGHACVSSKSGQRGRHPNATSNLSLGCCDRSRLSCTNKARPLRQNFPAEVTTIPIRCGFVHLFLELLNSDVVEIEEINGVIARAIPPGSPCNNKRPCAEIFSRTLVTRFHFGLDARWYLV